MTITKHNGYHRHTPPLHQYRNTRCSKSSRRYRAAHKEHYELTNNTQCHHHHHSKHNRTVQSQSVTDGSWAFKPYFPWRLHNYAVRWPVMERTLRYPVRHGVTTKMHTSVKLPHIQYTSPAFEEEHCGFRYHRSWRHLYMHFVGVQGKLNNTTSSF